MEFIELINNWVLFFENTQSKDTITTAQLLENLKLNENKPEEYFFKKYVFSFVFFYV